jgi:hypothetical protein
MRRISNRLASRDGVEDEEFTRMVREKVNVAMDENFKEKIALAVGEAIKEQLAPALQLALSAIPQQPQQHAAAREEQLVDDEQNADNFTILQPPVSPLPPTLGDREQDERYSHSHYSVYERDDRRDVERERSLSASRNSFVSFRNDLPQFLVEEKPPVFNKKYMSPPQYLDSLKEYFDTQGIHTNASKLACARFGLKKNNESWFDIHSDKINCFTDFEDFEDQNSMPIVDDDDFYIPKLEEFQEIVNNCNLLSENEKHQLLDLMLEFKPIFHLNQAY